MSKNYDAIAGYSMREILSHDDSIRDIPHTTSRRGYDEQKDANEYRTEFGHKSYWKYGFLDPKLFPQPERSSQCRKRAGQFQTYAAPPEYLIIPGDKRESKNGSLHSSIANGLENESEERRNQRLNRQAAFQEEVARDKILRDQIKQYHEYEKEKEKEEDVQNLKSYNPFGKALPEPTRSSNNRKNFLHYFGNPLFVDIPQYDKLADPISSKRPTWLKKFSPNNDENTAVLPQKEVKRTAVKGPHLRPDVTQKYYNELSNQVNEREVSNFFNNERTRALENYQLSHDPFANNECDTKPFEIPENCRRKNIMANLERDLDPNKNIMDIQTKKCAENVSLQRENLRNMRMHDKEVDQLRVYDYDPWGKGCGMPRRNHEGEIICKKVREDLFLGAPEHSVYHPVIKGHVDSSDFGDARRSKHFESSENSPSVKSGTDIISWKPKQFYDENASDKPNPYLKSSYYRAKSPEQVQVEKAYKKLLKEEIDFNEQRKKEQRERSLKEDVKAVQTEMEQLGKMGKYPRRDPESGRIIGVDVRPTISKGLYNLDGFEVEQRAIGADYLKELFLQAKENQNRRKSDLQKEQALGLMHKETVERMKAKKESRVHTNNGLKKNDELTPSTGYFR
eukprot:Nk52_evm68s223 gene=Nk52_evmTU68s223